EDRRHLLAVPRLWRTEPRATQPLQIMQQPAPSPARPGRTEQIRDDLDQSRRRGPLQHIQIPPCPALLAELQQAMSADEPDLGVVGRIASSDVAMAATLL
ncbi:hypothetical protein Q6272_28595, partial [Klebsiella pneumoniae]|uniref:hypothetical protein n=1 Tax=Klebsiella pneumoniae TaxID=573 RepID=UPI00272F6BB7